MHAMILTPSLNRCAPLLDDKKVDSVDLGWVTITQWLTKMALKLQVSPSRCSLITIGLFTFAASSGFALMVISISLNTWWFSFETLSMACDAFCPGLWNICNMNCEDEAEGNEKALHRETWSLSSCWPADESSASVSASILQPGLKQNHVIVR